MSIFENMSFLAIGINALMMLVIFLAVAFVAWKIFKIIIICLALESLIDDYKEEQKHGAEHTRYLKKGEN